MRTAIATLVLFAPICCYAQDNVPECEQPRTTSEISACLQARARQAEVEMERVLGELREKVRTIEEVTAGTSGAAASSPLEQAQAQAAWISFRDAQCRFAYAYAFGGSGRDTNAFGCLERLNRARADELHKILDNKIL